MKKYITAAAMAALLLTGCQRSDTEKPQNEPAEPRITVLRGQPTKGLFTASSFSTGDRIGVTMTAQDGGSYNGTEYSNVCLTAASSSSWNSETPLHLSNESGKMYAYYPYSEDVTDLTAIPVDAASQTDWMWATPASGFTAIMPDVTLTMNHALMAVRLSLTKGTYAGPGEISSVTLTLKGAGTDAVLDATDGTLTAVTKADISREFTETFTLSSSARTFEMTAIPTDEATTLTLTVVTDGNTYTQSITGGLAKAGKIQTYTAALASNGLQLYKPQVELWQTQKDGHSDTINTDDVNLTVTGTTDGISIQKMTDPTNGTITVKATPLQDNQSVNEVTLVSGSATMDQSVDSEGTRTITLSDIQSDITLSFSGTSQLE